MEEEIKAYIDYLLNFVEITKPDKPNVDITSYNDNEYILAINEVMEEFKFADFESVNF